MRAVIHIKAVLELAPEGLKELFVLLAVILKHLCKLGDDLLLDGAGNSLKLAVVLQHLSRNIQRKIGAVNKSAYEAEVIWQQFLALVHNKHAAGIKLEPFFILAAVIIKRSVRRDKQERFETRKAFRLLADHLKRSLVIVIFIAVKIIVLIVSDLILRPLPYGHHSVQGLILGVVFVLGLIVRTAFFLAGLGNLHTDRITDVIAVLFHQFADLPLVKELTVILAVSVSF